jgi:hypothetical protein
VPRCRYPECAQADDQIDTTADYDELYKEAERALADQRFDAAMRFAEAARDKAQSATGPTRDRDVRKAEDLVQRIQIDKARAEQALTARQALPIQIAWAHDASELRSGRTYQYQARLRLFNPYCGQPTLLNDPMQARIVEQAGPWSEPSDAVTIAPDTLVFMRSDRPANLEVRLEVFKWYAGEWLMRPFAVTIGDAIGEPRPAKTPRGDGKVTVDFGTGSTVVDIDFGHRTLVPDRRTGRLEPATTTALTYVDASGNLRQNLLALDKASETYGQLKGLVWKE